MGSKLSFSANKNIPFQFYSLFWKRADLSNRVSVYQKESLITESGDCLLFTSPAPISQVLYIHTYIYVHICI